MLVTPVVRAIYAMILIIMLAMEASQVMPPTQSAHVIAISALIVPLLCRARCCARQLMWY